MLYLNIVGVCGFGGWACFDEVIREPLLSGIPVYSVGDEVDGFLGNDMGAGHGDSLKKLGRSKDVCLNDVWVCSFSLSMCW